MLPSIAEVKELQRSLRISDHLVYLDDEGFTIAHTDFERRTLSDLEECPLHQWLWECEDMPVAESGYYTAFPQGDEYQFVELTDG